MDEGRIWGTLGIVLALAGAVIIALDSDLPEALSHGNTDPLVLYAGAVAVAALVTVAVIAPNMRSA
jgi:hypothetical protein